MAEELVSEGFDLMPDSIGHPESRRPSNSMGSGSKALESSQALVRRQTVQHDNEDMIEESHHKATFVDAAAMKEKVKQNLLRPKHTVTDYYKDKGCCQAIARSDKFEAITLLIIGFNALWIAIDTEQNDADVLLEAHPVFLVAENFFCAFFSFEWTVRFVSFRRKRDGFKDAWFVFDTIMVTMMVLETWVLTVLSVFVDGGSGGGNASVLRIARLMRLSRMARMARLLRAMPELMILIKGMTAAARSVFFTLCLLVLIMYVFSIAFVQLTIGTEVGDDFFPSVLTSMFTLLLHGTFLDDVAGVSRRLGKAPAYVNILFFSFVLLASLTVMNMLIGVLCEVVSAVAATEKEEMLVSYVHQKLHKVLTVLDTDGGGTISKTEFMKILENVDAVRCLQDVGVDVIGLVDFADFIFENDDGIVDDSVELNFAKFMDLVLQLRGTNTATVKDIVDLRKLIQNQFDMQNKKLVDELSALKMRLPPDVRRTKVMQSAPHSTVQTKFHATDSKQSLDEGVRADGNVASQGTSNATVHPQVHAKLIGVPSTGSFPEVASGLPISDASFAPLPVFLVEQVPDFDHLPEWLPLPESTRDSNIQRGGQMTRQFEQEPVHKAAVPDFIAADNDESHLDSFRTVAHRSVSRASGPGELVLTELHKAVVSDFGAGTDATIAHHCCLCAIAASELSFTEMPEVAIPDLGVQRTEETVARHNILSARGSVELVLTEIHKVRAALQDLGVAGVGAAVSHQGVSSSTAPSELVLQRCIKPHCEV